MFHLSVKILPAVAGLFVLGAVASCDQGPSDEQLQCEAEGGTWAPYGMMATMICYPHYDDAGKACTNSTQCQGTCEVVYDDNGATERGMCSETILGGCMDFFDDDGERQLICAD